MYLPGSFPVNFQYRRHKGDGDDGDHHKAEVVLD
jgi:hypothetical protein